MRRDGIEILARWREAGAWWEGEKPLEVVRFRNENGITRERSRILASYQVEASQKEDDHSAKEDLSLRPRKMRDEKVARAMGYTDSQAPLFRSVSQSYVPLHVQSGYTFGRSLLFARELPRRAAALGLPAIGIADRFSLAGAIEFARECFDVGVKPLIGATFELEEGGELVLFARDKFGYEQLSQLITECHLSQPRLFPMATWQLLEKYCRGLICLTGGDQGRLNRLVMGAKYEEAASHLKRLTSLYGTSQVFIEIERSYLPWEIQVNHHLIELSSRTGVRAVAGGLVTHAAPEQFFAQDVLVCADTLCQVEEIVGRKLPRDPSQPSVPITPDRGMNGERYLRDPQEMAHLFRDLPNLLEVTHEIADMCDRDVLPSRTRMPKLYPNSDQMFREIVLRNAVEKYSKYTRKIHQRLDHEIQRIIRLSFADHFLAMWDTCNWAKRQNILHSGRGSVVDSAVAYCLGLSRIDAIEHNLFFDRFLPEDGSKRPDIDIDFEARRRDDVRNYMIGKFGKERVATVAAFGAYNTRGIVREVGKALGLPTESLNYISKRIHGGVAPDRLQDAMQKRPELRDSGISQERLHWLFLLAKQLLDIPRNARAHSSGVVISDQPIATTVPVMWSAGAQGEGEEACHLQIIQWDKRSAKHYLDKFDILCLRGQDVLSGTQSRIRQSDSSFQVEQISLSDSDTYRTMRSGELIGVPQSASPAMRQAHIRLRTQDLTDASLVQAGIRPGVGGAVKMNELIARKRGKPFHFEHPDLEVILGITYGIVVFQEQIDQLLQTFAGYGSGEAEDIREEIHKRRREDYGEVIKDQVIARILDKGYTPEIAEHVFQLIAGFKGFGFAQGHALAFAEISVRSIYCQQQFPAEYFAALLDAQPAGYYGPCTLANEARSRGVTMLSPDINLSDSRFLVEDVRAKLDPKIVVPNSGIRTSLSQIAGLSKELVTRTVEQRLEPYESVFDYVRRARPSRDELESLILAGCFDSLHPNRRQLLWSLPTIMEFGRASVESLDLGDPQLAKDVADFVEAERAIRERKVLGMDIEHHLMLYERDLVAAKGGITSRDAQSLAHKQRAVVVGNPIRLRFPPTPSGKRVVFFDLEDEAGLLNVTCFDDAYQRDGHALVCSPYITVIGEAQWRDGHMAFLVRRMFPYDPQISRIVDMEELPVVKSDFLVG